MSLEESILSEDVLIEIAGFLPRSELLHFSLVTSKWQTAARSNEIWAPIMWQELEMDDSNKVFPPSYYYTDNVPLETLNSLGDLKWWSLYSLWREDFSAYTSSELSKAKIWWSRIEQWLISNKAFRILATLNAPASEEELDYAEKHMHNKYYLPYEHRHCCAETFPDQQDLFDR